MASASQSDPKPLLPAVPAQLSLVILPMAIEALATIMQFKEWASIREAAILEAPTVAEFTGMQKDLSSR